MTSFWALMHLVAAKLLAQDLDAPVFAFKEPVDRHPILISDEDFVCAYARLLGMPADEAWALALCRGDRREAFGG